MRRGPLTFTFTLAVTLTLALAGCSRAPGIDGVIVDQWPAMAEPTGWEPQAGVCYQDVNPVLPRFPQGTVECTQYHKAETIYIGQVADAAGMTSQPTADSPAYRAAWAECDAKTTEYVGGPWRERKIRIGLAFPTNSNWDGGARWFACQASAVQRVVGSATLVRFGLKGAFDSQPDLLQGCAQVSDGTSTGEWTSKSCDQTHNAEFVGTFVWEGPREVAKAQLQQGDSTLHRKCRAAVLAFAGATVRTGTYAWLPGEPDWKAGDNSVRCFLWLEGTSVSRSLKGAGRAGWPLK